MPDPIKLITRRITTMTYQAIDKKAQFIWGNVLSRNPDGTLNIDDGRGGCVLVVPPANVRTGDRISVDLGAMIGGVGMPAVATYVANVPQKNHAPPPVFIDNAGNTYNATSGARTGSGGTPTADVDSSFGYSYGTSSYKVLCGVSPSYADFRIGNDPATTGYQGESYASNNTVLCQGLGASAGLLLGIEIDNSTGPSWTRWVVNIRDASTFALIATNVAAYIHNWIQAHPADFFDGIDVNWDAHVSPDPSDGSFWINLGGNTGTATAPMFNVDPADGSLIKTVTLDTSAYSGFRRAHLVQA